MKKLILFLPLLIACEEQKSDAVVEAERKLDSTKKLNSWLIPCLECQAEMLAKGADSATAKDQCEKIHKPK